MTMLRAVTTEEFSLNGHPVSGIERRNGAAIIHLVGELDLYNAPEVRTALLELCAEQPERLVVDLGEVAFNRVELTTDAVVRTATAKEVTGGKRMYGLFPDQADEVLLGQPDGGVRVLRR